MDLSSILAAIFPKGQNNGRGGTEVNGLAKDTQPQNCEILARGQAKWDSCRGQRREFYVVRCQGVLLYLRICTAMEGSGYDEFAVIHDVSLDTDAKFVSRHRDYIERVSTD